jgi:hypothetical protein
MDYVEDEEGNTVPCYRYFPESYVVDDPLNPFKESGNGVSPSEPRGTKNTNGWSKVTKGGRHRFSK